MSNLIFPKVLVISHNCFSKIYNNGKTLEAIFSQYPKDNIAQLFFHGGNIPDFTFCKEYFRLSEQDLIKYYFTGTRLEALKLVSESRSVSKFRKPFIFDFSILFKNSFARVLREMFWICLQWNTKELKEWLSSTNPDYIFFVGGDGFFSHRIARCISKICNKPLVVYLTDDYILYNYNKSPLSLLRRYLLKKTYKKTIDTSAACFAIGDLMAEEYSIIFQKTFYPLVNTVNKIDYIPVQEKSIITISYFGGLHLGRDEMIINLAKLIRNISMDIEFNIYTTSQLKTSVLDKFIQYNVNYKGCVNGEDMVKAMQASDILLHVESDHCAQKRKTCLSVSTKIPEYLMMGRCVLGYGPSNVASMRLLDENHIGIVIDSKQQKYSLNSFAELLSNRMKRIELGERAYEYAVKHYENRKCCDFFQTIIINSL